LSSNDVGVEPCKSAARRGHPKSVAKHGM
jgi:hypothetical protein